MTTPLERAARALCGWTPNVRSWADICDDPDDAAKLQELYYARVRLVLEAIREPNDMVLGVGQRICNDAYLDPEGLPADAYFVWQSMIDSLLEEGK